MQRLRTVAAHVAGAGCSGSSDDPAAPTRQATGPLAGYRVLDMSAVISGPWSASILADQGADVIKIEGPARPDITRGLGSSPELGMAAMYVTANRGKRSVTLDLQQERGVEALKLMVKQSDVVIQNFRPGVNTRMGIDYAALSAVNPDLIMLTISGFGETGPYREARVYDPVIQAMAGELHRRGRPSMSTGKNRSSNPSCWTKLQRSTAARPSPRRCSLGSVATAAS